MAIAGDYARGPLLVEDRYSYQQMTSMTSGHLAASWAFTNQLSLGVHLPYVSHTNDIYYEDENDFEEVPDGRVSGFSDSSLFFKAVFVRKKEIALALMPTAVFGFSDGSDYLTDSSQQYGGFFVLSSDPIRELSLALNAGYLGYSEYWSEEVPREGAIYENRGRYIVKMGVAYHLSPKFSVVLSEHSHLGDSTEAIYETHEALLQLDFNSSYGYGVFIGGGYGLAGGSVPDYRFFSGLRWTPEKTFQKRHLETKREQKKKNEILAQKRKERSSRPWYKSRRSDRKASSMSDSVNSMQNNKTASNQQENLF